MRTMLQRWRRRHATVAAYAALFLALGGTAYAAATVTGENIVDGSVKSVDIGDGEVKYGDIAANSVLSEKILDENLRGSDVLNGSIGGADITNDSIQTIDIGQAAVRSSELYLQPHIVDAETNVYGQNGKVITGSCPDGETALSAGVQLKGHSNDTPVIEELYPVDAQSWYAHLEEADPGDITDWGIRLRLLCVKL